MRVNGQPRRTVWLKESDGEVQAPSVWVIDQRQLPFEWVEEELKTVSDVCVAIKVNIEFAFSP